MNNPKSEELYKQKYLKYKLKYLELQNHLNGGNTWFEQL